MLRNRRIKGCHKVIKAVKRFVEIRANEIRKVRCFLDDKFSRLWQRFAICALKPDAAEPLVVFLVPFTDRVSGGLMSITAMAMVTRRLLPRATVVLSTLPGTQTKRRISLFPNEERIFVFSLLCRRMRPGRMVLHIPEMMLAKFCAELPSGFREWLRAIPDLQVNILNQNILMMPEPKLWKGLFDLTSNVTQTTAHRSYSTQEVCDRFGVPLHHLSVYLDTNHWPCTPFDKKEKLIVFSPDGNSHSGEIKEVIRRELPEYRIAVVRNLKFMDYLRLVSRAMCTITFGEGFDAYFCQPVEVGSLGFAVYNEEFFPGREWLSLPNVYASWEEMAQRLPGDIRRLERNSAEYYAIQRRQGGMIAAIYGYDKFEDNLRRFYGGQYDYHPKRPVSI